MRGFRSKNSFKGWGRLAAKLGLLLTEPRFQAAIGDQFKDRADQVTDTVSSKYEDAVDRLEAARAALQGKNYWPSRTVGFLFGVGIGAGLGILFAPATGSNTRQAIRDKAADMKNKVVESTSMAPGKIRQSVSNMPFTGTEG